MKKNIILSSVLTILLCVSLIAGSTFALFTSESSVNIAVTAGNVEVVATIDENLELYSPKLIDMEGNITDEENAAGENFANGGTAAYENGKLTLSNITPGDRVKFNLKIENKSNVKIVYRTSITYQNAEKALRSTLKFDIGGFKMFDCATEWKTLEAGASIADIPCYVELPTTADKTCMGQHATIVFTVEAVQGNVVPTINTNKFRGTVFEGEDTDITLNGYDITHVFKHDDYHDGIAISIRNGAKLTLNDTRFKATTDPDTGKRNHGFFVGNGASLTINSGDYEIDGKWGELIWAQGEETARCTVTINGGNFRANASPYGAIVCGYQYTDILITGGFFDLSKGNINMTLQWQRGSTITVTGGTFVNYNPDGRGIIADGYKVVSTAQEDGTIWYSVVPEI